MAVTLETAESRLANAQTKLDKKLATIKRKEDWIAKKEASLDKLEGQDKEWALYDIDNYQDDIKRLKKEVAEIEQKLETYKLQYAEALEREGRFNQLPECLYELQDVLIEKWDAWDIQRRDNLKKEYDEVGYNEFRKNHKSYSVMEFMRKSDAEIHKDNVKDPKCLVQDLYERTAHLVGEIKSWGGIYLQQDNNGNPILNGHVDGEKGRCRIESIIAGGYNIQRLHMRVLTHFKPLEKPSSKKEKGDTREDR